MLVVQTTSKIKYLLALLCLLTIVQGCVSSSKYDQLFNENVNLKIANQKIPSLLESQEKRFVVALQKKVQEVDSLEKQVQSLKHENENLKNICGKELKSKETQDIQKLILDRYEKDLVKFNNFALYDAMIAHIGLDKYWDKFSSKFLDDPKHRNKNLQELREIVDRERHSKLEGFEKPIRILVSNYIMFEDPKLYSNAGVLCISKISAENVVGNTNLQASFSVSWEQLPIELPWFLPDPLTQTIEIKHNKTYQMFLDATIKRNSVFLLIEIQLHSPKDLKDGRYSQQTILSWKPLILYFVYPHEIVPLEL